MIHYALRICLARRFGKRAFGDYWVPRLAGHNSQRPCAAADATGRVAASAMPVARSFATQA